MGASGGSLEFVERLVGVRTIGVSLLAFGTFKGPLIVCELLLEVDAEVDLTVGFEGGASLPNTMASRVANKKDFLLPVGNSTLCFWRR